MGKIAIENIKKNLKNQDLQLELKDSNLIGDEPEVELLKKCRHLVRLDLSDNTPEDIDFLGS